MAVYVMSDLHRNYDGFMSVLKKINLTFDDYHFVNGDVVDRGVDGIKILQYMMMQPNIYPIMGNHEYALMNVLDFVSQELTEESLKTVSVEDIQFFTGIVEKYANVYKSMLPKKGRGKR